jgi:hypothetical protein
MDGIDNDGDTLTDWPNDPGCENYSDTSEYGRTECDDGVDNDGDTFVDTADQGCSDVYDLSEHGANECDDGIDNDADTLIDWPADTGCSDLGGNSEYPGGECNDGIDNDGDTLIDWPADLGCDSIGDSSERLGTACDDGVDNDRNSLTDWPDDPGCTDIYDNSEGPCVLYLECPSEFYETAAINCPIIYSGCTGSLSLSSSNTCTGATVSDNGDGTGSYNAPAQGEAAGPGACLAAVELAADSLSASDTVSILENNTSPTGWVNHDDIYLMPGQGCYLLKGGGADTDLPNLNPGDPGYLTCEFIVGGIYTVDAGTGAGSVDCWFEFTAPSEYGWATVDINLCDGAGACFYAYGFDVLF